VGLSKRSCLHLTSKEDGREGELGSRAGPASVLSLFLLVLSSVHVDSIFSAENILMLLK
jgi:hypothetical protein